MSWTICIRSSIESKVGLEPEPSSRPALVAVLLGLLMLCVATTGLWLKTTAAYELQQRAEQEGANPMERFDLGDVTLQVSGTEGAEVALDGQVIGHTAPVTKSMLARTSWWCRNEGLSRSVHHRQERRKIRG